MLTSDKIIVVSPQIYANQIMETNKETNPEVKSQKLERIQQSIDENNVKITTSIESLNKEIVKSKQMAQKTVANFKNINSEQTGSSLIVDDFKTVYELSYVRNITMILGMLGLASFVYNKWN